MPSGDSLALAEPAGDERLKRRYDLGRLASGGRHCDRGSGRGIEHQKPHDRGAAHGLVAARDAHVGVEFLDREDELCRRARVQALAVDDREHPHDCAFGRMLLRGGTGRVGRFGHLPASTRLATVMYLRPASWAWATASASGDSSRTLASLTSMGRLMPASTSTFGRFITEIERFDGVPPNMSVRIATPSPLSARLSASMLSSRVRGAKRRTVMTMSDRSARGMARNIRAIALQQGPRQSAVRRRIPAYAPQQSPVS